MFTFIIQNRITGCHGNGAISHNPNRVLFFWTKHVALSWSLWTIWCPWKIVLGAGCKVGLISRQPNIHLIVFHLDSDFLSHNRFKWYHKVLFSSRYIFLLLTWLENQDYPVFYSINGKKMIFSTKMHLFDLWLRCDLDSNFQTWHPHWRSLLYPKEQF